MGEGATTDGGGIVQRRLSYPTFGEPGDANGFTGLYYNRERYYAPELGRFLSADPLGMAGGGVNLYAYCGNDPVNFRDPFGLSDNGGDLTQMSWLELIGHGLATGSNALDHSLTFGLYSGGSYRCQPGFSTSSTMANFGRDTLIGVATDGIGSRIGLLIKGGAKVAESGGLVEEAAQVTDQAAEAAATGGCFTAGTLIATPEGDRPIERVKEGDHVLSADPVTKRQSFQKVEHAYSRHVDELYTIKTEDGRAIETTAEHPFWVEGKGFVFAKKLARSDLLDDESGNLLQVAAVTSRRGLFTVYNLTVERTHTFYAGGVWVHNAGTCPLETPNYVVSENGTAVKIPDNYVGSVARNEKGLVYQDAADAAAAKSNRNMIRVCDPDPMYPNGYARFYNEFGQPVDLLGKPGTEAATHIPF